MDAHQVSVARSCLEGAEANSMTFPQIVSALMQAGFESYIIDLRRNRAVYYLADGDSVALPTHALDVATAADFDIRALVSAIREAQTLAPGYTYRGFCAKAATAGCAGYMVSFLGRRAVYFGRSGETHVELFPDAT